MGDETTRFDVFGVVLVSFHLNRLLNVVSVELQKTVCQAHRATSFVDAREGTVDAQMSKGPVNNEISLNSATELIP